MADTCCDAMAEIMRRYDGPFYYPITIDNETHALKAEKMGVKLYNLTPSKKGIAKGSATAFLNFCPFCGKQLLSQAKVLDCLNCKKIVPVNEMYSCDACSKECQEALEAASNR